MNVKHYIGFDVHKKSISYCVKLAAKHATLLAWATQRSEAWQGAMEATLFSGWIYDTLQPFAAKLEIGYPAMMKAIGASKKKERPAAAVMLGGAERDSGAAADSIPEPGFRARPGTQ